jgi:hypothetical protein
MKHIKEFTTKNEYNLYINNNSERPLVSYVEQTRKVYYNGMPIFVFYIEGEEMYAEEGMKWEA